MKERTLQELASFLDAELVGNPSTIIEGVADLEFAGQQELSFLANDRYAPLVAKSQAGAILVGKGIKLFPDKNFLIVDNPSRAFQEAIVLFYPERLRKSAFTGIHPTALIAEGVVIGENVCIGPYCVIEEGGRIADNTMIGAHVYIGPHTEIGQDCLIHPHVTIRERSSIGNRVIIQPNAVIGSCGFGYLTDAKGVHTKLEQIGSVIIEDDVEIGACCTIDRGRFSATRIGKGSKIDNLVQIAHNVEIGPDNLIAAQSGVAGSSKTGKNVVMAGQSALVGHIKIADRVIIAARGAASKSIEEPGGIYAGAPMLPIREHNKQSVLLRNINKLIERIEELEKLDRNRS